MTARKTAQKTEKAPTYLDDFYAANGRKGYEFLEDVKFSGTDREGDRTLLREALAANARQGSPALAADQALAASGERGTITADAVLGDTTDES